MSWLGAGIGAGIGLMIGGPIGAAIGAGLGHYWTNNTNSKISDSNNEQEKQTIFFVTLNALLAKMAKADGVVSKQEITTITEIYRKIGLDSEDTRAAIDVFNRTKDNDISIYQYADQYAEIASLEMREMIYAVLWEVALADGKIHPQEDQILRRIVRHLKISDALYYQHSNTQDQQTYNDYNYNYHEHTQNNDQAEPENMSALQQHYAILGATKSDSDEEIKRKYRRKMAEFHPDKIQAKGLPEAFLQFANEQSAKINAAYEAIQKSRKK